MADLTPQEKERILQARQALQLQDEMNKKAKESKLEENINRKHGKLLFVSGIISLSCLALFGVIMLSLLLSGSDGSNQLMSAGRFYEQLVNLMVFNLNIQQGVINAIAIILSIVTIVTGVVLSSKILTTSREKIALYLSSTATIIVHIVTLSLLSLMMLFTIIYNVNFILILVLAGFITSIVFAILDLLKTRKLYKEEKNTTEIK